MIKILIILNLFGFRFLPDVAAQEEKGHYVIHCKILNKKGKVLKSFDGLRCLYLDDGSVISASHDFLQMHDFKMNLLWKKRIHTHHQLNFSLDKKKLLVMTSSIRRYEGQKVRFDRLSIYDLDGKELKWFDFFENLSLLKSVSKMHAQVPPKIATEGFRKAWKVQNEYGHANSFYEIENNALSAKQASFSEGNYIINSIRYNLIFILDKNMKNILWHLPIKHIKKKHMYHDVQLLKNGKILIFDNVAGETYSDIKLYDPIADKLKTVMKGAPAESFASLICCGGVQVLKNGNFLTINHLNGGYVTEMTPEGKSLWHFPNPDQDPKNNRPRNIQQARFINLDKFMKKNIGY